MAENIAVAAATAVTKLVKTPVHQIQKPHTLISAFTHFTSFNLIIENE